MTDTMDDLHFCKFCEQSKPAAEMRKDCSYASGYRPQCLDCKAKADVGRRRPPKKKTAKAKPVPFEERLWPCRACKQDIPFAEMSKDKRKFGGVGGICLECRRNRDRELAAEKEAEAKRQAEQEARQIASSTEWEYCFKCNSRHRPGILKQPPPALAAGYPDDATLCSKCMAKVNSREDVIRAERAKHNLGDNPTRKQLEAAARVSALRQLAVIHEDEYRELIRYFRNQLGVEPEKRWITL